MGEEGDSSALAFAQPLNPIFQTKAILVIENVINTHYVGAATCELPHPLLEECKSRIDLFELHDHSLGKKIKP